jgi:hypothetical protein
MLKRSRSPYKDSRNAKILSDPRQSSELKIFNFPMTEFLKCLIHSPENIDIDLENNEWVLNCKGSLNNSKTTVNIKNQKKFVFSILNQTVKLSGPGSDSLNFMLRYLYQILNKNVSDDRIIQRCKTINKKMMLYLGGCDLNQVPLDTLMKLYEPCINSIPIDQTVIKKADGGSKSVTRRSKKSLPKTTEVDNTIMDYEHNDDVFTYSIPTQFALAPSKYISASSKQNGIFTKIPIKKNQVIGVYKGVTCSFKSKTKSYDDMYNSCFKCCKHGSFLLQNNSYDMSVLKNTKVIDASIQNQSSFIRYINSGYPNYFYNNCTFVNVDNEIHLKATRNINPGEELLCSYGDNTESNIKDLSISVKIQKVDNDKVNYTYQEKNHKEEHRTMDIEHFAERYYEILCKFLLKTKQKSQYESVLKRAPIIQTEIYTNEELNTFKDLEFEVFMQHIKTKLEELKDKNLTGLKKQHYTELKEYYENKISKL